MNAELISVGTELLLGEILNTDAKFLSEELSVLGINVYYQSVVGDNPDRLESTLKLALSRADLVITSGGLGPTKDDLTKEIIAKVMDEKLVLHKESLDSIVEYFKRTGREMPESNIKQAMLPKNSIILKNNNGTAPGCIIEKNGKTVIMLPGPPNEIVPMFTESVRPYLLKRSEGSIYTKTYNLFGIGESKVGELLEDMMENGKNPTLAPYAKTGEVRLRLAAFAKNEKEAEELLSGADKKIIDKVGEYIYSTEDKTLPHTVVEKLIEKSMTIASAESCTGGMFSKMVVDIPGSSSVLNESIVTYSNEAKMRYLGVKEESLRMYGAVSPEVAYEMAKGIKEKSGADFGVAFTGIAGPDGGTKDKPVGLVYLAVANNDDVMVKKLTLKGSREKIRYSACLNGFDMVLKEISKM